MNTAGRKYLRRLKCEIGKKDPQMETYFYEIRADIEEYCSTHENVDYGALCEKFGEPSALASQFDEPGEAVKNRKKAKINPWLIVLIVGLAILIVILADHFSDLYRSVHGGYIVITDDYGAKK